MASKIFLYLLLLTFVSACNNIKTADPSPPGVYTVNEDVQPEDATITSLSFPSYVVYKDWQMGDPQSAEMILNVYKAWDGGKPGEMASYFADTTRYDFPDATRLVTTNKTVESTFRKWRNGFKETSNIPFSLISLQNKDRNQEWVIAWTWNKWRYADGTKDSMLYCDNWQIKNGKVIYLNSLGNRPSKSLSRSLNRIIPK